MDTLIMFTPRLSLAGQEADAVIDPGQGGAGNIPGPLGALGEYPVKLCRVSQQPKGAIAKRGGSGDDDLGDVLLEIAVTLAVVVGLEPLDRPPRQRAENAQQVGDTGLVCLVETDLTP